MAPGKVEFRGALEADMAAIHRMWARSYGVESAQEQRVMHARMGREHVLVGAAGGDIVVAGKLIPLRAMLGGREVGFGGIAALATFPEMRRRGYVQALLERMLADMKDQGLVLSGLYPFESQFYRRYGWALADESCTLAIPPGQLVSGSRCPGSIVEISATEAATLEPLRARFFDRFNLGIARDAAWWRDQVTYAGYAPPLPPRYVYRYDAVDGTSEGYVILQFAGPPGSPCLRVRELAAVTARARAALLAFVGDFDSQVVMVELATVNADPLRAQLARFEGVEVQHRPHQRAMMRIVDVHALIDQRPIDGAAAEATLDIDDEHARWNHGSWRIAIADGRASIETARAPAEAALSIQTATQLATGFLSVADAVYAGLVTGTNPWAAAILTRLAGNRIPFHNDAY